MIRSTTSVGSMAGLAGLGASITDNVVGIVSRRIKMVSILWKVRRDSGGEFGAGFDDDREGCQIRQLPLTQGREIRYSHYR